jgi:hypothetical protein
VVLTCAEVLARAAVLASAAVAVATDALIAVQAAMRPAATRRLPRRVFPTRVRIDLTPPDKSRYRHRVIVSA